MNKSGCLSQWVFLQSRLPINYQVYQIIYLYPIHQRYDIPVRSTDAGHFNSWSPPYNVFDQYYRFSILSLYDLVKWDRLSWYLSKSPVMRAGAVANFPLETLCHPQSSLDLLSEDTINWNKQKMMNYQPIFCIQKIFSYVISLASSFFEYLEEAPSATLPPRTAWNSKYL